MSRRTLYPMVAAGLSVGAPLGLGFLRWLWAGQSSWAWVRGEFTGDARTYMYIFVSTMVVFSAFGLALGRSADQLADLSVTDALTGLGSRRHLQERLEGEFARSRRYGTPLSLLILDVDGLKELNDRHGHRAGDRALRRAAAAIRDGARGTDFGARWGGDEFVLLAPNTDVDEARNVAERICHLASQEGAGEGRTLSVGVATLEPGQSVVSSEWLLHVADQALYEAKRAGRNRVATHRRELA